MSSIRSCAPSASGFTITRLARRSARWTVCVTDPNNIEIRRGFDCPCSGAPSGSRFRRGFSITLSKGQRRTEACCCMQQPASPASPSRRQRHKKTAPPPKPVASPDAAKPPVAPLQFLQSRHRLRRRFGRKRLSQVRCHRVSKKLSNQYRSRRFYKQQGWVRRWLS